ncbi:MAG: Ig-like domain-containing protein [Ignavibacteriaceae bacterium]|nr:Ig-like domain-containing protein [Ignavibacteriaceae bacterium]
MKKIFRIDRIIYVLVSIVLSFLLISGCKKNNPITPSEQTLLQGNQAFHASAVAGYQTVGAGASYPLRALQLSSPTGSPIHTSLSTKNLLHSIGSNLYKRNSNQADSIVFVPYLNLYGKAGFSGNILLMSFYNDAAGTQSAGTVKATLPTDISNISDPTSYTSYPANITVELNITGGNLPCKGNLLISFTGGTGANTMTGTNTLTRDIVVFTLKLALDDHLNATGSITITESGATIEATNVQGQVFGNLTCDIKISPYGWTGTGILNLITGSMIANVNTGTGISTATSDSLGNLNINYADGTKEIVVDALGGDLIGGGTQTGVPDSILATSGTPQSALVSTAFASPLMATVQDKKGNPVSGVTVTFTAPESGQSGTFAGGVTTKTATTDATGEAQISITANSTPGDFQVTASVTGVTTAAIFSLTNISNAGYNTPLLYTSSQRTIVTINNNGHLIGYLPPSANTTYTIPVYWSSPTSQPKTLQISAGDSSDNVNGFNDNDQIVGNGYYNYPNGQQAPSNPVYWSSPTAVPTKLAVPVNLQFAIATSINNSGQIVGWGVTSTNSIAPLYWSSPTDIPQVLQTIASTRIAPNFIGSNGNILAGFSSSQDYGNNIAFWSSHTAQPVVLKGLTGSVIISPLSINAAGVIVGYCQDSKSQTPVTWANVNATPQILPLPYAPSALGSTYAASINTAGVIVGAFSNGKGGGDCTIWKNGQVTDLAVLINNFALGTAQLVTDQGWILGQGYYGYNQYILIPK